jgi:hypothetical protein
MEISSIIKNPSLVEIANSTSNSSSVKKINEVDLRFDSTNFDKYYSPDQKAAAITDNPESYSNPATYNYQLQTNSPASRINTNVKLFNEKGKINDYEVLDYEDDDSNNDYSYEITDTTSSKKTGLGYYFVINGPVNSQENNLLNNYTTEFQKKINKTYHLNNFREPGTLVNLVL